jgi:hypothetical protein
VLAAADIATDVATQVATDNSLSNSLPEAAEIVPGNTVMAAPAAADMAPDAMAVTEGRHRGARLRVAVPVVVEGATEFASAGSASSTCSPRRRRNG